MNMNAKNFSVRKTYFFKDYEDYFDVEPNGFEDCIFECDKLDRDLDFISFKNKYTDKVLGFSLKANALDNFIEVAPMMRSNLTDCPVCFERDLVSMDYYAYDPWADEDVYEIETYII